MSEYTDRSNPPSREGLEPHQHWVWMWDKIRPIPTIDGWLDPPEEDMSGHWEVVGTGALLGD